jgi:hypothetical protein
LAGLFLQATERDDPQGTRSLQGATGVLQLTTTKPGGVLSLEALALNGKRAGRVRFWLELPRPSPGVSTSDLLLLSPGDSPPDDLETAGLRARNNTTVRHGETIGIYWEFYGVSERSVPLPVSLTLIREQPGILRRALRAFGVVGKEHAQVSVSWIVYSRAGSYATPVTITLDLAGQPAGKYTLRLQATGPDGKNVEAQRQLTIVNDDGARR